MTTALEGGEGSASRPGSSLSPGKTRYPLYRRLGGPQGRSGQVRKISPPTGIRSPDRPVRSQSLYWLSYRSPPVCDSPISITFIHNSTDCSSHKFRNLTDKLMGGYAAIPTEALLPDLYYIVLSVLLIILNLELNLQVSIFIFWFIMPATFSQTETDRSHNFLRRWSNQGERDGRAVWHAF